MPIDILLPLRQMTQDEFGQVAYEVVGHAFTVHGKLGGIFDESVYRTTLKHILSESMVIQSDRCPELPIHGDRSAP
jgi:hypothetical protein